MTLFKGAGVALVTPFDKEDKVDYEVLEELIERQIVEGTDSIVVCGTTGEPSTMSEEEKIQIVKCTINKVNGRVPVIVGTGGNSTSAVIDFSKKIKELGVDGQLIVTPYYNKAMQRGLYEHYSRIASQTSLPIIIYNVPSRTGCNILPETVVRLARDCDNIVGIKEASGDISQVARLAALAKGDIDIYSGNDDQIIPILSLGGVGVISVLSNIVPKDTHRMVCEYLSGNRLEALALQLKYSELISALFCEVNPIPVKAGLELMGYKVGIPRLPLTRIEECHLVKLKEELIKIGAVDE